MISQVAVRTIADSLEFHYFNGGCTPLEPNHYTGWRSMPLTVVSRIDGASGWLFLKGGARVEVPDGAVFVAPGLTHRYESQSGTAARATWAHFEFRILSAIDVLSLYDLPRVVQGDPARRLSDLCADLAALEPSDGLQFSRLAREKQLGFRLLETLVEKARLKEDALIFLGKAGRLAPVLKYIEEHLAEPIQPAVLARTVNLSVPHLYTLFKQAIGSPPLAYQRRRRLDRAHFLLATTDLNITEVAEQTGFCDPYHFSKQFKTAFGLSPSAFKKSKMPGVL